MATTYPPAGEDPFYLQYDRAELDGAVLEGIAYGLHIAIFSCCAWTLLHRVRNRYTWLNLTYIIAMMVLGTLSLTMGLLIDEQAFVYNRGFTDGPNAWIGEIGDWSPLVYVLIAGNTAAMALADGLLLYRAWLLWDKRWLVIVVPFILYIGTIGTGIANTAIYTSFTWIIAETSNSCSTALNIILTLLIIVPLLRQWRTVKHALGDDHARTYSSLAVLIVESAVPYTLASVFFLASYGLAVPSYNVASRILNQVTCITPEVIILRLALRRAPSAGRPTWLSSMRFNATGETTGGRNESGTTIALGTVEVRKVSDADGPWEGSGSGELDYKV